MREKGEKMEALRSFGIEVGKTLNKYINAGGKDEVTPRMFTAVFTCSAVITFVIFLSAGQRVMALLCFPAWVIVFVGTWGLFGVSQGLEIGDKKKE